MSIELQLPKMFLRGSLAWETMANLTPEQQAESDWYTDYVANHPDMQRHKRRYIRDLSNTIGGDYRDPEAAIHDYNIIIWRGVVMLFYHKKYEFECTLCGSRTAKNQSGTVSEIRGCPPVCPNCKGASDTEESPIRVIVVDKRHPNPKSVIDDPTQMSRWFSQQLNNATRQQLRENPIKTITRTNIVTDYADSQILSKLKSILSATKISNQVVNTDHGVSAACSIFFDTLAAPARVIGQLAALCQEAAENGVIMQLDNTGIKLQRGANCTHITQSVVEKINATVLTPSQVGPDTPNPLETPSGAEFDHVAHIASSDFLAQVTKRLPTENCRATRDIIIQEGKWYAKYVAKYGDSRWTWKNIELLLGVSKKEMNMIREQIAAIIRSMEPVS